MENKIEEIFIVINKIELASELAEMRIENSRMINECNTIEDENGCMVYTDEAQDIFNDYYDEYLTLIEQCNVNLREVKR
jgi:hypothetical protein